MEEKSILKVFFSSYKHKLATLRLQHVYVGHPISSDYGLISQKLLLNSELYILPTVCGHGCCPVMFGIWNFLSQPDLTLVYCC